MVTSVDEIDVVAVPPQSYLRLFLRFLRFGLLAWGGPVAQIAMIRQELVVGLITATTLRLLGTALPDAPAAAIFALALLALYSWKAKAAVAGVMLGAGALGLIVFQV
jgi:chromate transport protein ChrA